MTTPREHDMTPGQLAAERPARIPIFERLGLDYCCGGKRSLAAACSAAGVPVEAALRALQAIPEQADEAQEQEQRNWLNASMTELADHIEQTHHALVRDSLMRLTHVIPRVVAAHGRGDPRLARLAEVVRAFGDDMNDHMVREERVLFPWLRRLDRASEIHTGPPWSVRRPISCMVHDHDDAGLALAEMRSLTDGFTPPSGACGTYRSMLETLKTLEADTHIHIHKENNILFPAGIRAEELHQASGRHLRPNTPEAAAPRALEYRP